MRVSSGVRALDDLLDGGFPDGTVTLVIGPVSPAVRHLARCFLIDGLGRLESGLMVQAREAVETERAQLAALDPHLEDHESEGRLRYVDASVAGQQGGTLDGRLAVLADPWNLNGLTAAIERARSDLPPRKKLRVVIDALDPLLNATDPSPVARFLQVLFPRLERAGATTLVIADYPEQLGHAMKPVETYAPVRLRLRAAGDGVEVAVDGPQAPAIEGWHRVDLGPTVSSSDGADLSGAVG